MVPAGRTIELISPAKINLSLAILGKQPDGFHALHSVVTQTEFGDRMVFEWNPDESAEDRILFENVDLPEKENTLWQALQIFRARTAMDIGQFTIRLKKLIPVGAGLGGGSSNAVTVFHGIQKIFGESAEGLDWASMAAEIGSDCPLFLNDNPVIMEGRGERITELDKSLANRFCGKRVILFKPSFSINTAEAYGRLARGKFYQSPERVRELILKWENGEGQLPPKCNDFERLLEDWMPSLAIVLERLREKYGLDARLSGSGSACFVFPYDPGFDKTILQEELAKAWGRSYWIQETCIK